MEGSVVLKKIGPIAGMVVLSVSVLAGCGGGSDDNSASGGGSAAADCPLVDADDPGNSEAPSDVPAAEGAPKLAEASNYSVAFSQNASNNPWRLAETASMKS